jgi:hypothetical protein
MDEQLLTMFKVTAVMVLITLCAVYERRKTRPVKKPLPHGRTMMHYYDADLAILTGEIENARNLYHLQMIRESIKDFKKRYADYQCPVILQIDTNTLVRSHREKRITFEIRIAIFN